jgi:periplasmic protein TonB
MQTILDTHLLHSDHRAAFRMRGVQPFEDVRGRARRKEVSVAEDMFHDVVEASVNVGGKRKYSVVVSIVAHAIVIAATVIVPIVATNSDLMPVRSVLMAFAAPRPMPPPAPPPPSATHAPRADTASPAVPVEAPPEIPVESEAPPIAERLGTDMSGIVPGGDYSPALMPSSPSPTAPPARAPVRPGGDVKPPVKVKEVAPEYPRLAQETRVEGIVVIEATIGPTGKVQDARVLRSIPLLDAAALDAVRQWEYTPTLLNGSPVAVVMTVTVQFRLR